MDFDARESWRRIDSVLERYAPQGAETFAPPASESQMQHVERALRVRLPDDFKQSLRIHNGQLRPSPLLDIFDGCTLLPTEVIVSVYRDLTRSDGSFEPAFVSGTNITWKGPLRPWIPFAWSPEGLLCIATKSMPGVRVGEVVRLDDGTIKMPPAAPSFGEWLADVAGHFVRGEFLISDNQLILLSRGSTTKTQP